MAAACDSHRRALGCWRRRKNRGGIADAATRTASRTRSRVHTAPHHRQHSRLTPLPLRFPAARQTRAPLAAPAATLHHPLHSPFLSRRRDPPTDCGPIAMSPFTRLATVELQLVMHFCDQRTLIALARCSRAALAAASQPFAWRSLSPLSLSCSSPLELSARMAASLPRHAQLAVEWTIPAPVAGTAGAQEETHAKEDDEDALMAAEIAALVSLPGLRHLSVDPDSQSPDSHLALLMAALRERVGLGGALVSLTLWLCDLQISEAVCAALAGFLERSRTLTTLKISSYEMDTAMVRALTAGLQKSESLATLNLSGSAFGDDGAIALAAALSHSRSQQTAAGLLLHRRRRR